MKRFKIAESLLAKYKHSFIRAKPLSLGYNYNDHVCTNRIKYFSSSTGTRTGTSSKQRKDPTAKRPNKICDPYGLNGQSMSLEEAKSQLTILDPGWSLEPQSESESPLFLRKEFCHLNYMDGAKFLSTVAAVAHINNHYPSIKLERRLMKREKAWRVVTTVDAHTEVLGGLSFHDFHVAMLIDVEVAREDIKRLVVEEDESLRKQT
jgi:pterin-4a-carbinolamine dehydratase